MQCNLKPLEVAKLNSAFFNKSGNTYVDNLEKIGNALEILNKTAKLSDVDLVNEILLSTVRHRNSLNISDKEAETRVRNILNVYNKSSIVAEDTPVLTQTNVDANEDNDGNSEDSGDDTVQELTFTVESGLNMEVRSYGDLLQTVFPGELAELATDFGPYVQRLFLEELLQLNNKNFDSARLVKDYANPEILMEALATRIFNDTEKSTGYLTAKLNNGSLIELYRKLKEQGKGGEKELEKLKHAYYKVILGSQNSLSTAVASLLKIKETTKAKKTNINMYEKSSYTPLDSVEKLTLLYLGSLVDKHGAAISINRIKSPDVMGALTGFNTYSDFVNKLEALKNEKRGELVSDVYSALYNTYFNPNSGVGERIERLKVNIKQTNKLPEGHPQKEIDLEIYITALNLLENAQASIHKFLTSAVSNQHVVTTHRAVMTKRSSEVSINIEENIKSTLKNLIKTSSTSGDVFTVDALENDEYQLTLKLNNNNTTVYKAIFKHNVKTDSISVVSADSDISTYRVLINRLFPGLQDNHTLSSFINNSKESGNKSLDDFLTHNILNVARKTKGFDLLSELSSVNPLYKNAVKSLEKVLVAIDKKAVPAKIKNESGDNIATMSLTNAMYNQFTYLANNKVEALPGLHDISVELSKKQGKIDEFGKGKSIDKYSLEERVQNLVDIFFHNFDAKGKRYLFSYQTRAYADRSTPPIITSVSPFLKSIDTGGSELSPLALAKEEGKLKEAFKKFLKEHYTILFNQRKEAWKKSFTDTNKWGGRTMNFNNLNDIQTLNNAIKELDLTHADLADKGLTMGVDYVVIKDPVTKKEKIELDPLMVTMVTTATNSEYSELLDTYITMGKQILEKKLPKGLATSILNKFSIGVNNLSENSLMNLLYYVYTADAMLYNTATMGSIFNYNGGKSKGFDINNLQDSKDILVANGFGSDPSVLEQQAMLLHKAMAPLYIAESKRAGSLTSTGSNPSINTKRATITLGEKTKVSTIIDESMSTSLLKTLGDTKAKIDPYDAYAMASPIYLKKYYNAFGDTLHEGLLPSDNHNLKTVDFGADPETGSTSLFKTAISAPFHIDNLLNDERYYNAFRKMHSIAFAGGRTIAMNYKGTPINATNVFQVFEALLYKKNKNGATILNRNVIEDTIAVLERAKLATGYAYENDIIDIQIYTSGNKFGYKTFNYEADIHNPSKPLNYSEYNSKTTLLQVNLQHDTDTTNADGASTTTLPNQVLGAGFLEGFSEADAAKTQDALSEKVLVGIKKMNLEFIEEYNAVVENEADKISLNAGTTITEFYKQLSAEYRVKAYTAWLQKRLETSVESNHNVYNALVLADRNVAMSDRSKYDAGFKTMIDIFNKHVNVRVPGSKLTLAPAQFAKRIYSIVINGQTLKGTKFGIETFIRKQGVNILTDEHFRQFNPATDTILPRTLFRDTAGVIREYKTSKDLPYVSAVLNFTEDTYKWRDLAIDDKGLSDVPKADVLDTFNTIQALIEDLKNGTAANPEKVREDIQNLIIGINKGVGKRAIYVRPAQATAPYTHFSAFGISRKTTLDDIRGVEPVKYLENTQAYFRAQLEKLSPNKLLAKAEIESKNSYNPEVRNAAATLLAINPENDLEFRKAAYDFITIKGDILATNFLNTLAFLTGRTPSQAKQNTTIAELVSFSLNESNVIYLSPEGVANFGADHDGDQNFSLVLTVNPLTGEAYPYNAIFAGDGQVISYEQFRTNKLQNHTGAVTVKLEKTILEEYEGALNNYIFNLQYQIYSNPENFLEMSYPITMDTLNAVTKNAPYNDALALPNGQTSIITAAEGEHNNQQGRMGIPTMANSVKVSSLYLNYVSKVRSNDVRFMKLLSDLGINPDINLKNPFQTSLFEYQSIAYTGYNRLTTTLSIFTNSDRYAAFLNYLSEENLQKYAQENANKANLDIVLNHARFVRENINDLKAAVERPNSIPFVIPTTTEGEYRIITSIGLGNTVNRRYDAFQTVEVNNILALTDQKLKNQKIIEYVKSLTEDQLSYDNKQTWQGLSELLSAATDNAKELILSKINANSDLGPHMASLLVHGFSLIDAIDIINQPGILNLMADYIKATNRAIPLKTFVLNKIKYRFGDSNGLEKLGNANFDNIGGLSNQTIGANSGNIYGYLSDPYEQMLVILNLSSSMQKLIGLIGTNKGLKNDYSEALEYGLPGFDLLGKLTAGDNLNVTEMNQLSSYIVEAGKLNLGINPYLAFLASGQFSANNALLQKAFELSSEGSIIFDTIKLAANPANKFLSIPVLKTEERYVYARIAQKFASELGTHTFDSVTYDFSNPATLKDNILAFITAVEDKIDKIKFDGTGNSFTNNPFIKLLELESFTYFDYGKPVRRLKLPNYFLLKSDEGNYQAIINGGYALKSISEEGADLQDALHLYLLLQQRITDTEHAMFKNSSTYISFQRFLQANYDSAVDTQSEAYKNVYDELRGYFANFEAFAVEIHGEKGYIKASVKQNPEDVPDIDDADIEDDQSAEIDDLDEEGILPTKGRSLTYNVSKDDKFYNIPKVQIPIPGGAGTKYSKLRITQTNKHFVWIPASFFDYVKAESTTLSTFRDSEFAKNLKTYKGAYLQVTKKYGDATPIFNLTDFAEVLDKEDMSKLDDDAKDAYETGLRRALRNGYTLGVPVRVNNEEKVILGSLNSSNDSDYVALKEVDGEIYLSIVSAADLVLENENFIAFGPNFGYSKEKITNEERLKAINNSSLTLTLDDVILNKAATGRAVIFLNPATKSMLEKYSVNDTISYQKGKNGVKYRIVYLGSNVSGKQFNGELAYYNQDKDIQGAPAVAVMVAQSIPDSSLEAVSMDSILTKEATEDIRRSILTRNTPISESLILEAYRDMDIIRVSAPNPYDTNDSIIYKDLHKQGGTYVVLETEKEENFYLEETKFNKLAPKFKNVVNLTNEDFGNITIISGNVKSKMDGVNAKEVIGGEGLRVNSTTSFTVPDNTEILILNPKESVFEINNTLKEELTDAEKEYILKLLGTTFKGNKYNIEVLSTMLKGKTDPTATAILTKIENFNPSLVVRKKLSLDKDIRNVADNINQFNELITNTTAKTIYVVVNKVWHTYDRDSKILRRSSIPILEQDSKVALWYGKDSLSNLSNEKEEGENKNEDKNVQILQALIYKKFNFEAYMQDPLGAFDEYMPTLNFENTETYSEFEVVDPTPEDFSAVKVSDLFLHETYYTRKKAYDPADEIVTLNKVIDLNNNFTSVKKYNDDSILITIKKGNYERHYTVLSDKLVDVPYGEGFYNVETIPVKFKDGSTMELKLIPTSLDRFRMRELFAPDLSSDLNDTKNTYTEVLKARQERLKAFEDLKEPFSALLQVYIEAFPRQANNKFKAETLLAVAEVAKLTNESSYILLKSNFEAYKNAVAKETRLAKQDAVNLKFETSNAPIKFVKGINLIDVVKAGKVLSIYRPGEAEYNKSDLRALYNTLKNSPALKNETLKADFTLSELVLLIQAADFKGFNKINFNEISIGTNSARDYNYSFYHMLDNLSYKGEPLLSLYEKNTAMIDGLLAAWKQSEPFQYWDLISRILKSDSNTFIIPASNTNKGVLSSSIGKLLTESFESEVLSSLGNFTASKPVTSTRGEVDGDTYNGVAYVSGFGNPHLGAAGTTVQSYYADLGGYKMDAVEIENAEILIKTDTLAEVEKHHANKQNTVAYNAKIYLSDVYLAAENPNISKIKVDFSSPYFTLIYSILTKNKKFILVPERNIAIFKRPKKEDKKLVDSAVNYNFLDALEDSKGNLSRKVNFSKALTTIKPETSLNLKTKVDAALAKNIVKTVLGKVEDQTELRQNEAELLIRSQQFLENALTQLLFKREVSSDVKIWENYLLTTVPGSLISAEKYKNFESLKEQMLNEFRSLSYGEQGIFKNAIKQKLFSLTLDSSHINLDNLVNFLKSFDITKTPENLKTDLNNFSSVDKNLFKAFKLNNISDEQLSAVLSWEETSYEDLIDLVSELSDKENYSLLEAFRKLNFDAFEINPNQFFVLKPEKYNLIPNNTPKLLTKTSQAALKNTKDRLGILLHNNSSGSAKTLYNFLTENAGLLASLDNKEIVLKAKIFGNNVEVRIDPDTDNVAETFLSKFRLKIASSLAGAINKLEVEPGVSISQYINLADSSELSEVISGDRGFIATINKYKNYSDKDSLLSMFQIILKRYVDDQTIVRISDNTGKSVTLDIDSKNVLKINGKAINYQFKEKNFASFSGIDLSNESYKLSGNLERISADVAYDRSKDAYVNLNGEEIKFGSSLASAALKTPTGELRFQRAKTLPNFEQDRAKAAVTPHILHKIAERLNKALPSMKVEILNSAEIRERYGVEASQQKGFNVRGENLAIINADLATLDTPMHEIFGHSFMDYLKATDPLGYKNVVGQLLSHPMAAQIKADNPDLIGEEALADEIFATLLGLEGKQQMSENDLSIWQKFKNIVERFKAFLRTILNNTFNINNDAADNFPVHQQDSLNTLLRKLSQEALKGEGSIIAEMDTYLQETLDTALVDTIDFNTALNLLAAKGYIKTICK